MRSAEGNRTPEHRQAFPNGLAGLQRRKRKMRLARLLAPEVDTFFPDLAPGDRGIPPEPAKPQMTVAA